MKIPKALTPVIWITGAIVITIVLYLSGELLGNFRFFTIREIAVEGATRQPVQEVVDASGFSYGRGLYSEDITEATRKIEKLPWVKKARISRKLTGLVSIKITEWQPKYLVSLKQLQYLTAEGHIIEAPLLLGLDFPVVTGHSRPDIEAPGDTQENFVALLKLLDCGSFPGEIDEINYDPGVGYTIFGGDDKPMSVLIGKSEFEERFSRLKRLQRSLVKEDQSAVTVDLCYDDRIVAKLVPNTKEASK